jgi:hypothetical protein
MSRAGWNPRSPYIPVSVAERILLSVRSNKDFVDKAYRHLEFMRYLLGGQRGFPPGDVLDEALRDLKGKQSLETAAGLKCVGLNS